MGLFTNEPSQNVVLANEQYDNIFDGTHDIMIEACQDDMAFFTMLVHGDVNELNAMREGADLEPIWENAISDAWNKVKEFIKKVWAKIKALFEAFIARVTGFITKDGKTYAKKYYSLALKNIGEGRCKNIKYKIRPEKSDAAMPPLNKIKNAVDYLKTNGNESLKDDLLIKIASGEFDNNDLKKQHLNSYDLGDIDETQIKKELVDRYFDDEEGQEGIDAPAIAKAKSDLEGNSDAIKGLNKTKSEIDSAFKLALKKADELQKRADDDLKADTDAAKDDNTKKDAAESHISSTKIATGYRSYVSALQDVSTAMIGASSEIINIKFKQARKVMALAASAAGRKKVSEAAEDEALDFYMDEEAAYAVELA